jgi:hypothetical protein
MIASEFETLSSDLLVQSNGGVRMQLTQYGYPHDPYGDSETRKGHGAYSNLANDRSVALTDSALRALGLNRSEVRKDHPWININLKGGGTLQRRIDDRAPEKNNRVDMYEPGGFNHKLPDYADISLRK